LKENVPALSQLPAVLAQLGDAFRQVASVLNPSPSLIYTPPGQIVRVRGIEESALIY
jgi:hypothetical protein